MTEHPMTADEMRDLLRGIGMMEAGQSLANAAASRAGKRIGHPTGALPHNLERCVWMVPDEADKPSAP